MFLSVYILDEPSDPGHRLKAPISRVRAYRIVSTQLRQGASLRVAGSPPLRCALSSRKHSEYWSLGANLGINAKPRLVCSKLMVPKLGLNCRGVKGERRRQRRGLRLPVFRQGWPLEIAICLWHLARTA